MIYKLLVAAAAVAGSADAFTPNRQVVQMKADSPSLNKVVTAALAGIFTMGSFVPSSQALTKDETLSLSYEQVKGSGLANRCPEVKGTGTLNINGKKKIVDMCVEPISWQVEEEVADKKGKITKSFVPTKLMTRQTYSLDGVSGTIEQKDGKLTFTEEDGIDYAATTIQTPGGERVPFLFSLKDFVGVGNSGGPLKEGFEFGGSVTVPSYRTGLFLDPKGRGTTTGYDFAGALPGLQNGGALNEEEGGSEKLFKENNKRFEVLQGNVQFAVKTVNEKDGEFGGIFVSNQPSDTDMGAKVPKKILTKGIFYARVE